MSHTLTDYPFKIFVITKKISKLQIKVSAFTYTDNIKEAFSEVFVIINVFEGSNFDKRGNSFEANR